MEETALKTDSIISNGKILLGMSISLQYGRIQVYDSTLSAIGRPEYFKFLFDEKKDRIALMACNMNDEGSFKSRKTKRGSESYIHCTYFVSYLYDRYGWENSASYILSGRVNEQIIEFMIRDAVMLG